MRYFLNVALIILLLLSLTVVPTAYSQTQNEPFIEGIDYFPVSVKGIDNSSSLEQLNQVADIEVYYWYGCQPCQQVEQAMMDYLQQYPELQVRRTPSVAHIHWREQAYLQPLIEQLRLLDPSDYLYALPDELAFYEACLADCQVFSSFESGRDWIYAQAGFESPPVLDLAAIWQAEKNYRKRADSFSISQVPTIIIKESYRVDADSAKSVERLIRIVDYLLKR